MQVQHLIRKKIQISHQLVHWRFQAFSIVYGPIYPIKIPLEHTNLCAESHISPWAKRFSNSSELHGVTIFSTNSVSPEGERENWDIYLAKKLSDRKSALENVYTRYWTFAYQVWNSSLVHSNLWSQSLKPLRPGSRGLNSALGVLTITAPGAMYPNTTSEKLSTSSSSRCSILKGVRDVGKLTNSSRTYNFQIMFSLYAWKTKDVAHLQLNTCHKIKSFSARLPLCDRPLVQLNGQRPLTWLKIITHKWSQCMPGKKKKTSHKMDEHRKPDLHFWEGPKYMKTP